jgi:hypothetical protein
MWHRVEVVLTDVTEERIASIFRVEGKIRKSAREAFVRDVKSRLLFTSYSHRRENLRSHIKKVLVSPIEYVALEALCNNNYTGYTYYEK